MNKFFITLAIFASCLLWSCSGSKDEPDPATPTVRTVLVYMVANNSLGTYNFDSKDLEEMKTAAMGGQLGNSRWLVYHHARNSEPKLMELNATGEFTTVKEYSSQQPSVSIARMQEVLADMRKLAPAEDYGIVLWSHATGWLQNGMIDSDSKLKSFGEDGGRTMNITALAEALSGTDLSFIYADCCYMGCVEVAYQLRDCADYFVASVAELPAEGMDYSKNMRCLTAKVPDMVGAANNTFRLYEEKTKVDDSYWCTMSVIDLRKMGELAECTAEVYKSGVFPTQLEPQTFTDGFNYYSDLAQFVEHTSTDATLLARWSNLMSRTVLYAQSTPHVRAGVSSVKIKVDTHCGLSTFILNYAGASAVRNYRQLDWYNDVACFQPLP